MWKLPGPEEGSGSLCVNVPGSGVSTHSQAMAVRDVLPEHTEAGIKAVPGSSLLGCSGLRLSGQECPCALLDAQRKEMHTAGAREGLPLLLANINIIKLNIVFRDPGFSFM